MALYFFHVFAEDHLLDMFGTHCADTKAIRLHMLTLAQAACHAAEPQNPIWSIEVVDANGTIVAAMDLINSLLNEMPPLA